MITDSIWYKHRNPQKSLGQVHSELREKGEIIQKQHIEINDITATNKKLKKEVKEKLSSKDAKNSKLLEKNCQLETEVANCKKKMMSDERLIMTLRKLTLTIYNYFLIITQRRSILNNNNELTKLYSQSCYIF